MLTAPDSRTIKAVPSQSLRVLLAEDNLSNQRVAEQILVKAGHRVTVVCDGLEACKAAQNNRFDIILLDIQMPVLSGIEAAQKIRATEQFQSRTIPILAVTAMALPEEVEQLLTKGIDGYVVKPFKRGQLLDAVHAAAQRRAN